MLTTPLYSQSKVISGVINQYRAVTSLGSNFVTVTDASPFAAGDTVMLMQMSGVIIQETGQPGQFLGMVGTAGEYELFIIDAVDQGSDVVTFTQTVKEVYDTRGMVQLITVPSYDGAVAGSMLTCDQWDSSAGTGGVLAFSVRQRLTLNSDINVSGKGFRGGDVSQGAGICTGAGTGFELDFYNSTSTYSGFKGEGVGNKIINASTDIYPGYSKGKAPSFSGGGGGNGYSSGGGGGSNYGAGGAGGLEYTTCNQPPVLQAGGGKPGNEIVPALNGHVLMGGGGGASTYPSSPNMSPGGNGGGIIVIFADTIAGGGRLITARGASAAPNTVLSAGAGGGGGGGSVIIKTRYFSSYPVIDASGGDGGNTVNLSAGCTGGGGGGGLIWTSDPFDGTVYNDGGTGGYSGTNPSNKNGNPGKITTGLELPLNGFLYNAVYSEKTKSETDSICEGMIPPVMKGTQPFGGTAPYQIAWQKSYDNNTWSSSLATSLYYTPTAPESATVWFRRVVTDNNGLADTSKSVRIIVHPAIGGNIAGKDTAICINQDPLSLDPLAIVTGGNNIYTYNWQQSANDITWSSAIGSSPSYDPGPLSITTYYRRIIKSGACADTSTSVIVNVLPAVTANTIADNQMICEGGSFADLTGSAPSGGDGSYAYQWQSSPDGSAWGNAPGTGTLKDYNPSNDSPGSYYFRRVVSSGLHKCCTSTSSSVTLVSLPEITNNSISSPQTICEGDAIAGLNGTLPAGGAGVYSYQWQRSANGTTWTDLEGATSQNYLGERVYDATYYRRIVYSSSCTDLSGSVFITVIPAINNYDVALESGAPDTICTGTAAGKISGKTVTGGNGSYSYSWYYSEENDHSFQPLPVTTSDYQPGVLTKTTWFLRVVGSSLCTVSDTVRVVVLPVVSGNIIAGSQTVCNVEQPARLTGQTPAGGDGIYRYIWEKKDEMSGTWMSAPGDNTQRDYNPPALGSTTEFRRRVLSGEGDCCASLSENTVTVTIDIMPQDITAGEDQMLNPYQFAYTMQGGFTGAGTGLWSVVSSEGDPVFDDPGNPATVVRKLGFGENRLRFQVRNNSCVAAPLEIDLKVPKLLIPEGFSPNGDGINEYFNVEGLEYTTNELVIINTGGAVVYKTTNYKSADPAEAWTGLDNNGDELPDGTYYYLLTITGASDISTPGYKAHLSGFIIIRR